MLRLVSFLYCLSFFLTGCAYDTPLVKPDVLMTNRWSVANRNIVTNKTINLPYLAWWQGFHDVTLTHLIKTGLANNNTLNMSRGHIKEAEGELKKIRYQWIPTIDFMTGYSRNPATGFPGVLAVFVPSYVLNIFRQLKEQKQAKYALAQVKAEDDAVKLTIISQITLSYFTYQAEIEHRQLLKALADDLTHFVAISNKIYRGGLSSNIDPQEAYSDANRVYAEQQVVEHNIVVSRNVLRYLINQNPGKIITTRRFLDFSNKQLIPGALPLTVLSNRPDLQMAENRLRASNEGIGLAASNLLPTIKLDLIGGLVAGNSRYAVPDHKVYFNDQLLQIPILKMSVLGEIAKAQGLNQVSYFNYIDVLQKALRDTTNALSNNDRVTKKLQQTADAQRRIARAHNLTSRLYNQGIQTYLVMLKSKIALDRINIELNQVKLQQLITVVNLYQELAGGYKSDEQEKSEAIK